MADRLLDIPIKNITPNPHQPRTEFDEVALQELAASIREHGLIQPVAVTPNGSADHFTLLAGERRWRAAQMAGLEKIPAIVRERVDDQTRAEIALIENVQREGLSVVDEARAYEDLATRHQLSNGEIAQRVGKDRATIANLRGLLRLPDTVLALVGPGDGQIPQGVARMLSQVAKFKSAAKDIAQVGARIAKGERDRADIEDLISSLVAKHALEIRDHWDTKWLTTPVTIEAAGGSIEVRACEGCQHFVKLSNRDRYCAEQPTRCYLAKHQLYAQREIERVSKATRIPIAGPDEKVTVLTAEYRHEARVAGWLRASQRPDHLRLIAASEQRPTYTLENLLKSDVVLLASTDEQALTRSVNVPAKTPAETPTQRAKREAAEEQSRVERRAEKAQKRRAQHDIDWLGLNTARMIAPQITTSGSTLEWLAMYVNSHSAIGAWPVMRAREDEIEKLLDNAKGKVREALLKEFILVHLIGSRIAASYDVDWHEDWDNALADIKALIADKADPLSDDGLGLRLPPGWDKPPVHKTASNCWRCGRFSSMEHLTKRDIEEGWVMVGPDEKPVGVTCPNCSNKSSVKHAKASKKEQQS